MPIVSEDDIRSQLAEGRITALSIDTNIFDEKGLRLSSPPLLAVSGLKDRHFSFILPGTVAKEVIDHLEREADAALRSAKKGIGEALYAFETTNPTRDELLASISGNRTPSEAADQRFTKYVHDTGCTILDDVKLVDTATIFDSYFSGTPPFGSGKKKDEFPDALALNALEATALEQDTRILVVSKDGDWHAFCESSERLFLLPDIERALAILNDAPLGLRKTFLAWLGAEDDGRAEVVSRLENIVEHLDVDVTAQATHGELEAYPSAGILREVGWPNDSDVDIIESETSADGNTITAFVSLPLLLAVRFPVELSFSIWDSVDRESVGMGGRIIEVDESLDVRATIVVNVVDLGSADEQIEFVSCEIDIQSFEIDLGEVDVFEPEDYWDGED
ncbi:PIN domain-containing protein [Mesorhizobium sp. ISC11]|uniref:PIN domain-containing protein n=1 Tax=Mesorhizobium sp. ISC11 TaxID=3076428 RepID=UPI00301B97D7